MVSLSASVLGSIESFFSGIINSFSPNGGLMVSKGFLSSIVSSYIFRWFFLKTNDPNLSISASSPLSLSLTSIIVFCSIRLGVRDMVFSATSISEHKSFPRGFNKGSTSSKPTDYLLPKNCFISFYVGFESVRSCTSLMKFSNSSPLRSFPSLLDAWPSNRMRRISTFFDAFFRLKKVSECEKPCWSEFSIFTWWTTTSFSTAIDTKSTFSVSS